MAGYKQIQPRWKKGESGNPKGRPKLPDLKDALANCLSEEKNGKIALESIVETLVNRAIKGDSKSAELLFKYGYKQATQEIDITSSGKELRSWTVKSV